MPDQEVIRNIQELTSVAERMHSQLETQTEQNRYIYKSLCRIDWGIRTLIIFLCVIPLIYGFLIGWFWESIF
jgi:hypothetical protein